MQKFHWSNLFLVTHMDGLLMHIVGKLDKKCHRHIKALFVAGVIVLAK
jgi:hypothetical protein